MASAQPFANVGVALPAVEDQGKGVLERSLPAVGPQPVDVVAHLEDRFLVTFRAPAAALLPLVPAPFTIDARRGLGFVSVCALTAREMGPALWPRALRFRNAELLYRASVRVDGEPTFLTLRSDVSATMLSTLGRFFSHYRPRRASVEVTRDRGRFRLECRSSDGLGDGVFEADRDLEAALAGSVFEDAEDASRFLVGMSFSAALRRSGRVQIQEIEHTPWHPKVVTPLVARFPFLDQLSARLGVAFEHDCTLHMADIDQRWKATRCR